MTLGSINIQLAFVFFLGRGQPIEAASFTLECFVFSRTRRQDESGRNKKAIKYRQIYVYRIKAHHLAVGRLSLLEPPPFFVLFD